MKTYYSKKGFTITELYVSLSVLVILVFSIGSVYLIGARMFDEGFNRIVIRNDGANAMEAAKIHLIAAKNIDAITSGSLTFTADMGSGDESYRLYLYHEDDLDAGPPFTRDYYQLRLAQGDTSYGQGKVLADYIESPIMDPPFSRTNNLITLDWTLNKNNSLIRFRTNVRPRNL